MILLSSLYRLEINKKKYVIVKPFNSKIEKLTNTWKQRIVTCPNFIAGPLHINLYFHRGL